MSQILVRNLDPRTVDRLKKRARLRHRSLQAEVKDILERSITDTLAERRQFVRRLEAFRKNLKFRQTSDSADLIREDRDR